MKRFFNRLQAIISIVPVVWKSYDFDYQGGLDLLQWHLKRLKKDILFYNIAVGDKKRVKDISIVINIINRLRKHEYYHYFKACDIRLGDRAVEVTRKGKKLTEVQANVLHKDLQNAKRREDQEYKLMMKILTKHLRDWWV